MDWSQNWSRCVRLHLQGWIALACWQPSQDLVVPGGSCVTFRPNGQSCCITFEKQVVKFITFEPSCPSLFLELDSWDFPDQGTPWWGFWSRLQQVDLEIRSVLRLRKNAVIVWWDVLWSGIPSAIVTADRALNVDGELIFARHTSHIFTIILCVMFSFCIIMCLPSCICAYTVMI